MNIDQIPLNDDQEIYLECLLKGMSSREIIRVFASEHYFKKAQNETMAKYGVNSKTELVVEYLKSKNPGLRLAPEKGAQFIRITDFQITVLTLLIQGKTFRQIALELGKTYRTVNSVVESLKRKFIIDDKTHIRVIIEWLKILNPRMKGIKNDTSD